MGELIPLPNGQSATLRAPEDVSERLRRPITRAMRGIRPDIVEKQQAAAEMEDIPDPAKPGAMKASPQKEAALRELQWLMTNEEADAYQTAGDLAIVALVERWTFPQEVTVDGLLDLPGRTLDELRRRTGPYVAQLFVDASPDPNPPAPSGGSNGSATPSAEAQQTTSLTSGATTNSSASA